MSLAVHAPLRPSCGVRSPQLDRIVEHWGLAALMFLLGCATKFLRLRDPPNRKRLGADPCSLFTNSPQSFWALRFNRTLSACEPCGSRTSPTRGVTGRKRDRPRYRVLVSIARPNWRVPGSCDPCALLRPLRKIFGLCDPADSRLPRPCDRCSLSQLRRKFLRLSAQCGNTVKVL